VKLGGKRKRIEERSQFKRELFRTNKYIIITFFHSKLAKNAESREDSKNIILIVKESFPHLINFCCPNKKLLNFI